MGYKYPSKEQIVCTANSICSHLTDAFNTSHHEIRGWGSRHIVVTIWQNDKIVYETRSPRYKDGVLSELKKMFRDIVKK